MTEMEENKKIQGPQGDEGSGLPAGQENQKTQNEAPNDEEDVNSKTGFIEEPSPASIVEPQIENMEVHHHGHVHHQKKWKEYLFQFCMLFLAVFCGFLAEYQLEHVIENQREKQYVKSFIEDLKADTGHIADLLQRYNFKHRNVDTFLSALKDPSSLSQPELLYKHIGIVLYPVNFIATDRTIEQLKNSGGLRLIKKQSASDSIISYSLRIKEIVNHQGYLATGMIDLTTPFFQIFDVNQIDYPNVLVDTTLLSRPKNKSLLSKNPELLNVMFNKIAILKGAERIHIDMLQQLNATAVHYINFLQKQYRFE